MPQGTVRIVDHPARRLVGYRITTPSSFNDTDHSSATAIPALFTRFWTDYEALGGPPVTTIYGAGVPADDETPPQFIDYFCGVESDADLKGSFVEQLVPAGRYLHYTHAGLFETLDDSIRTAYFEYMPKSGLSFRDAPHLELYDERFDPSSPTCEMDILIPVE